LGAAARSGRCRVTRRPRSCRPSWNDIGCTGAEDGRPAVARDAGAAAALSDGSAATIALGRRRRSQRPRQRQRPRATVRPPPAPGRAENQQPQVVSRPASRTAHEGQRRVGTPAAESGDRVAERAGSADDGHGVRDRVLREGDSLHGRDGYPQLPDQQQLAMPLGIERHRAEVEGDPSAIYPSAIYPSAIYGHRASTSQIRLASAARTSRGAW
jgi:hypothetical protein